MQGQRDLSMSEKSLRELQLQAQMIDEGMTGFERHFRFCRTRKFEADFAFPYLMLLIEVEGGTWINGRHNTGAGYAKDCEKYDEAEILGYHIIRVTSDMVDSSDLKALNIIKRMIASIQMKQERNNCIFCRNGVKRLISEPTDNSATTL